MWPESIRGFIAGTSTVAVLCGPVCIPTPKFEINEQYKAITQSLAKPWENVIDARYQNWQEEIKLAEQIKILHSFASRLLEDSKEIEPEIVAMVNEDFWQLI